MLCLFTGDFLPVQLDVRFSESAGKAADEADSVAQRSFTPCLVLIAAENGLISPLVF